MAILRQLLTERTSGSWGEDEDSWTLCLDTEAQELFIEHEWTHMNPYKASAKTDRGTKQLQVVGYSGRGADKIEEAKRVLYEKAGAYGS